MSLIIFNRKIATEYYRMRILCPDIAVRANPGQFVMIRVADSLDPLLRRPFGIHRKCQERGTGVCQENPSCIEILYRIVGKGTFLLSRKKKGEPIDILGPLGNGFYIAHNLQTAIIVAGGIGVAPLFSLAQALKENVRTSKPVRNLFVFLGGKTSSDILLRGDLKRMGAKIKVSTEDGSLGEKGMVTELLEDFLAKSASSDKVHITLFGCGPLPMLYALSKIASAQGISCQLSLESRMACGVGACLGCSIPILPDQGKSPPYHRVCTEGPVFDSGDIRWDDPYFCLETACLRHRT